MRVVAHSIVLALAAISLSLAAAQPGTPIPTLAVPTLQAAEASDDLAGSPLAASAVDEILELSLIKAGVLYNEPPYSALSLQGELRGFDIALLRLIAELWGSEIEFAQVTRENALDKLYRGDVHLVASAFVHYRDLDEALAFSQPYLVGRQAMMIAAGAPFQSLSEMAGQRIGYVIGTRAEKALSLWSARLDGSLNQQFYLTLDRAFSALTGGEIDGLVAPEQDLLRVSADYADRVRLLEEAVVREPRALAIRRHDIGLRHLLNHSIQLLAADGSLLKLYRETFPDSEETADALARWDGIGETVTPTQYAGELTRPARYVIPRMQETGALRVGGIAQGRGASSAGEAQLAALNHALARELARRWGVSIEIVGGEGDEAVAMLERGEVDLIAGVKPDWRLARTIDFSSPYLLHGDRLMVAARSGIGGFNDLRGRIIGVIAGDEGARDRAQAWADSINASVRFFQAREDGAALQLLEFNNVNAVYADSLLLVAHLQANPNALRLTDRWYSRSYYAFGLPYNDLDFRLLVDYTIQELVRDGTLRRLSGALILSDDMPDFGITPGAATFAGFSLAQG